MPILHITIDAEGLPNAWRGALARALEATPGPVTVLTHGFKYQPGSGRHCPHRSLLSGTPQSAPARRISWPRRLGFRGHKGEGLALCLGWPARGSIWAARDRAALAGARLAEMLAEIRRRDPSREIRFMGHSLGARVGLTALALSDPGTVRRVVLLSGAEFTGTAREALRQAGPLIQPDTLPETLNITSRENDLFDFLLERLVRPPCPGDRMLGFGDLRLPGLATVQLDDPASLAALRRAGFPVAPSERRICHWSSYVRVGVFPLYRAFLSGRIGTADLQSLLPPQTAPRWSRLRPAPAGMSLPFFASR